MSTAWAAIQATLAPFAEADCSWVKTESQASDLSWWARERLGSGWARVVGIEFDIGDILGSEDQPNDLALAARLFRPALVAPFPDRAGRNSVEEQRRVRGDHDRGVGVASRSHAELDDREAADLALAREGRELRGRAIDRDAVGLWIASA